MLEFFIWWCRFYLSIYCKKWKIFCANGVLRNLFSRNNLFLISSIHLFRIKDNDKLKVIWSWWSMFFLLNKLQIKSHIHISCARILENGIIFQKFFFFLKKQSRSDLFWKIDIAGNVNCVAANCYVTNYQIFQNRLLINRLLDYFEIDY